MPQPPAAELVGRIADIFSSDAEFLIASEGRQRFTSEDAERWLAEESAHGARIWLVTEDDEVLGLLTSLLHPAEKLPWIGLLLVDARRRGNGVGSRAVAEWETMMASEGWTHARLAVLHATPASRRYWSARGWGPIGERTTLERGLAATVFEKRIS